MNNKYVIGILLGLLLITGSIVIVQGVDKQSFNPDFKNYNSSADPVNSTVIVYSNGTLNSLGSGFVYQDDYIVTNAHVVDNSQNHSVEYVDGSFTEAELVGLDQDTDIAVLEVEQKPSFAQPLPVTNQLPNRLQPVRVIGHPRGLEYSITTGIISNTEESFNVRGSFSVPDMIQTDAALNNGNSGGPLIAEDNVVVGMNTATKGENLGLSVSGRMINRIAESIIETGNHQHPFIGVQTQEVTPLTNNNSDISIDNGLVVKNVVDDSPASNHLSANKSIDNTDIITGVDGVKLEDNEDLASYLLLNKNSNDSVELTVYNNGEKRVEEFELGKR